MRNIVRWRRSSAASLAALAVTATALAIAASPASARSVEPDTKVAAKAASTTVSARTQVSAEAWAAGRAKYGAKVTAAQALDAYWTPARMRAAKPIEESKQYQTALQEFQRSGKRADVPDAVGPAQSVAPKAGHLKVPAPSGPSARAHNPNYNYWHPTAYTNGKVFFRSDNPNDPNDGVRWGQCSASIINTEGKDTVWTASHCVHSGAGGWWYSQDWMFIPAYDDDLANPRPYGTWYAAQLYSTWPWVNSSDFSQDFAVAIMNTLNGWHIVDYFGGHGFRANWGVGQWINSFGYPAEWPYDGGNLHQCWGSNVWESTWNSSYIGCDMTRGSSGGPWLHGWDGNWGYLNGVNSRIDRIVNPTIMASPYFDDDAWNLFNNTRYL